MFETPPYGAIIAHPYEKGNTEKRFEKNEKSA
jgi:hypothetical protein